MAVNRFKPLLDRSFLRGEMEYEFRDYLNAGHDAPLLAKLQSWLGRELKKETQAEGAFVQRLELRGCNGAIIRLLHFAGKRHY